MKSPTGMAKKYTPKANDLVFVEAKGLIRYVVVDANAENQTARVKNVSGDPAVLTASIPWVRLVPLDESQNAAQIVKEATEDR